MHKHVTYKAVCLWFHSTDGPPYQKLPAIYSQNWREEVVQPGLL